MSGHSDILLSVRDLQVRFDTADNPIRAVNGLRFATGVIGPLRRHLNLLIDIENRGTLTV
jgi:hypothetical protein